MSETSLASVLEELARDLPPDKLNRLLDAIETELSTPQTPQNDSEISELNLIIKELEKRNEELESTNRELSDKVVNLNKSDLELKKSQELKREVERLSMTLSDKERNLNQVNNQLYELQEELKKQKADADARDRKLRADRQAENEIVAKKSDEKAKQMQNDFIFKWGAWTYIFASYGFLITFLMGFTSKAFTSHFKAFWSGIWNNLNTWLNQSFAWSNSWAKGIENAVGKWCVENLVGFLIALIPLLAIAVLTVIFLMWFGKNQADKKSAIIGLLTLAYVIFRADHIAEGSWNIITLWIVLNLATIGIRRVLAIENPSGKTLGEEIAEKLMFWK